MVYFLLILMKMTETFIFIGFQCIFGFYFLYRILFYLNRKKYIQPKTIIWHLLSYLLIVVIGVNYNMSIGFVVILTYCVPALIALYFGGFFIIQSRLFKQQMITFLDQVLLNMKMGRSFNKSLQMGARGLSGLHQMKIQKILQYVFLMKQPHSRSYTKDIREFILHLQSIHIKPHGAVERVQFFRKKIYQEEVLRKKYGSATQQTQVQSVVLTIFFIALLAFICSRYGFVEYFNLITLSSFLFFVGLFIIFLLGRTIRWKF